VSIIGALVAGLGAGGLYAVIGVCLVLMATLTRVINFAQVAVGVYAAFLAIRFVPLGVPQWGVVIIAIIVGAAVSALLGWIIATWLPEASSTARSAVTVAGLLFLLSLSFIQFGSRPQSLIPLVSGPLVSFGVVTVTKLSVALILLAVAVAIVAKIVLTKTPVGVQLRAISDRQTAAELLGINVKVLQIGVWSFTGAISALAICFAGNSQAANAGVMVNLVIPGAAAALIGAFKRLDLAIIGGIILGGIQGLLTAVPGMNLLRDWIPILTIVIFLLWSQRKEIWDVAR
jgi:branched-chain amino acid transport system permease protein